MSILGDRLQLSARISRKTSNALIVTCVDASGAELAVARQKGSAGVLFGFKNGGKSTYTAEGGGTELTLAVDATTQVSRGGQPLGSIVGEGKSARIESAGGTVLAQIKAYPGARGDDAWFQPLLRPDGGPLGMLALMRTNQAWSLGSFALWVATWDMVGTSLKAPSAGSVLQLDAPVDDILGDLLVAAVIDAAIFPRGYCLPD